jgi:hypothetical protein
MTRSICLALALTTGLLTGAFTASPAHAGTMDYALANAGTRSPYSQLVDAIPTPWSHLRQPMIGASGTGLPEPPISARYPADMAETGVGGAGHTTLGHILAIGISGADRAVYGIYDRLAVLPAPIFLYFDWPVSPPSSQTRPWASAAYLTETYGGGGGLSGSSGGSSGTRGSSGFASLLTEPQTIPEPGTLALLACAGLLIRGRRSRVGV